jgi:hypothetical protein
MDIGIVYLIQPCELIGTERYKVGYSKHIDMRRIIYGYNNGSYPICITMCINPLEIEKKIKKEFKKTFKLISGTEYFEGNINLMFDIFIKNIKSNNDLFKYNRLSDINLQSEPQVNIMSSDVFTFVQNNYINKQNEVKVQENSINNAEHIPIKYKYSCDTCKYKCVTKCNWHHHINTNKHIYNMQKLTDDVQDMSYKFICDKCDKQYKSRSGLWNHKQISCY